MKIQLWKIEKESEDSPAYKVIQRQRLNNGTNGYEEINVGWGYEMEAPDGTMYLSVKILGFSDNKPCNCKKNEK